MVDTTEHEIGKVIEIGNGTVLVQFQRSEACAKCKACARGQGMEMTVEALNLCEAKMDDNVKIEVSSGDFLTASFLLYGLPLFLMLAGFIAGNRLFGELAGFISGTVMAVLAFALIKLYDNRKDKKVIVTVVEAWRKNA